MKKDIEIKKVQDVAIAIIPKDEAFWDVFLLNFQDIPLRNVIISSKGYGELNDTPVKTSVLRYFYEEVPANASIPIEPLPIELQAIANEFWISFQVEGYLYDKKYVFVAGSLSEINFTNIPFHEEKGVMIR